MTKNTHHCGRPNYIGPTEGNFGFLHHDTAWEYSHNVIERVDYVRRRKPAHEIQVRLDSMFWIDPESELGRAMAKGKSLYDDYWAKRKLLNDEIGKLFAAHWPTVVPDAPWDGQKLVFT